MTPTAPWCLPGGGGGCGLQAHCRAPSSRAQARALQTRPSPDAPHCSVPPGGGRRLGPSLSHPTRPNQKKKLLSEIKLTQGAGNAGSLGGTELVWGPPAPSGPSRSVFLPEQCIAASPHSSAQPRPALTAPLTSALSSPLPSGLSLASQPSSQPQVFNACSMTASVMPGAPSDTARACAISATNIRVLTLIWAGSSDRMAA